MIQYIPSKNKRIWIWQHLALLAAAKSLQLCPTLCDPIDGSPPSSHHPWDSPGKNTGVGCHFLLQCMKEKSESEVAQSCPTLSDPMDCSLPGSSGVGCHCLLKQSLNHAVSPVTKVHTLCCLPLTGHKIDVFLQNVANIVTCLPLLQTPFTFYDTQKSKMDWTAFQNFWWIEQLFIKIHILKWNPPIDSKFQNLIFYINIAIHFL